MIEEEIFNLLTSIIEEKIDERNRKLDDKIYEISEEKHLIQKKYQAIEEYENDHRKELNELGAYYAMKDHPTWTNYSAFELVLNDFRCMIENLDYHLECINKIDKKSIIITYKEFIDKSGLNSNSMKKYLHILKTQAKIDFKKEMGGLSYQILRKECVL